MMTACSMRAIESGGVLAQARGWHYPPPVSTRFLGRILLLAGIWFCFALPAFAAGNDQEWWARPWQTEDDLPDNSVNALAQSEDGYLWIGTPSGLARFDGIRFDSISLTNV